MRMIFHTIVPVIAGGKHAPQVRLFAMMNAFDNLGYEVELVDGYTKERKQKIYSVKENLKNGIKYDFLYSESDTEPTFLSDPPESEKSIFDYNLDYEFIKFVKSYQIPTAIFYRDIFWKFSNNFHLKSLKNWKLLLRTLLYKYDLFWYKKVFDIIYLPSLEMQHYLSELNTSCVKALPPGHNSPTCANDEYKAPLNMLYVGGVTRNYQINKVLRTLKHTPDVEFVICTREYEWKKYSNQYKNNITQNTKVVHLQGDELTPLYQRAGIACLFVEPLEYWSFAQPVKLYEYIGNELPIVATKNTLSGQIVEENDIGWTLEYDEVKLEELLQRINNNPIEIMEKKDNVKKIKEKHSWLDRAKQVVTDTKTIE